MSGLLKALVSTCAQSNLYAAIIASVNSLHPSPRKILSGLHRPLIHSPENSIVPWRAASKEVIRPQVPLRPPCYDFSLLTEPRFDATT